MLKSDDSWTDPPIPLQAVRLGSGGAVRSSPDVHPLARGESLVAMRGGPGGNGHLALRRVLEEEPPGLLSE
eukprot:12518738-Alexandrium_andersonii.AAC.1